ncbi:MAG: diguanylate cyclase [Candidatus Hydrogenedentota bacterium]
MDRHTGVLAPVDDLALYHLIADSMVRALAQHSAEELVMVVDSHTARRLESIEEIRPAAAAIYHYGDPPSEWGHAGNLTVIVDGGEFRAEDCILLLFNRQAALAILGTRNPAVEHGADSFTGAWTSHRESVQRILARLPECGHVAMPAPDKEPGSLLETSMHLATLHTNLLVSRQRTISMDKDDLASVLEILKAISAKRSAHDILFVFVENIARVVSSDRCSIVRVWGKHKTGQVLASHEDASLTNRKIELSKYPELKHVLHSTEKIVINDVYNHPITKPCVPDLKKTHIRSLLVIPIVLFDRNVGSLFLRAMRTAGSFTLREISFFEIVAEAAANALERAELFESIQQANERLEYLATTDGLTGLFNHRSFRERLEEEVQRALRYQTPLACMIFDVDNFKTINDSYGHLQGDSILAEIAERTNRTVRRTDIVARYGGEEFVVIMPQTGPGGALTQAERVRAEIAKLPFKSNRGGIPVSVSVGVAVLEHGAAQDSEGLILKADRALYKAKAAGKNCVSAAE